LTSLDLSHNKFVSETDMYAPREGIQVGDIIDGNPVIARKAGDDGDEIITILRLDQVDGVKALADRIVLRNVATTSLSHLTHVNLSAAPVLSASVPHLAKVVAPAMNAARDRVLAAVHANGLQARPTPIVVNPTAPDYIATVFAPVVFALRTLAALLEAFAPCHHQHHIVDKDGDDAHGGDDDGDAPRQRRRLSAPLFARLPGALWAHVGRMFFAD
jgi:hypothetical protein